jgi:hypothetical protein
MEGSVYFGATAHVADHLQALRNEDMPQRYLLVMAKSMNLIDVAGAELWRSELRARRAMGGDLYFHRPRPPVVAHRRRDRIPRRARRQSPLPRQAHRDRRHPAAPFWMPGICGPYARCAFSGSVGSTAKRTPVCSDAPKTRPSPKLPVLSQRVSSARQPALTYQLRGKRPTGRAHTASNRPGAAAAGYRPRPSAAIQVQLAMRRPRSAAPTISRGIRRAASCGRLGQRRKRQPFPCQSTPTTRSISKRRLRAVPLRVISMPSSEICIARRQAGSIALTGVPEATWSSAESQAPCARAWAGLHALQAGERPGAGRAGPDRGASAA